jgi:hypothetical protein
MPANVTAILPVAALPVTLAILLAIAAWVR